MSFRDLSKNLAQALDQFLCHQWNLGPSQGKVGAGQLLSTYFRTRDLDLAVLKLILAQVMSCTSPQWSYLHSGTDGAVTMWSSMNDLMEGCRVSDLDLGHLHSTSADLTIMFMAKEKSGTEIVQPVIMHFSSLYQADVSGDSQHEVTIMVQNGASDHLWNMVPCYCYFNTLVWDGVIGFR